MADLNYLKSNHFHKVNLNFFSAASLFLFLLLGSAHAQLTVSAPTDPKGIQNPIVEDGHPNCELNLNVTVSGGTAPYTFLWKRGAANVGTTQNLVIRPSKLTDQGIYTCVVTDATGLKATSAQSRVAVLNISDAVSLAAVGQATTTVSVSAQSPTALSYRWYKWVGSSPVRLLAADGKYAGVTSSVLTIKNVAVGDATSYFCRVFANGYYMDSGNKRLVVLPAPTSKIVAVGSPAELEVMPENTTPDILAGMTYQWKKGTVVLGTSKKLELASLSTSDAGDYVCSVRLSTSLVSVNTPISRIDVVTSTPRVQLAAQNLGAIVLSCEVSPAIGRTFNWFKNGSVVPIANTAGKYAGATTNLLTIQNVQPDDAAEYTCQVSAYGSSVTSAPRKLLVAGTPASKLVKLGNPFQLEMVVHGLTPEIQPLLSYQWKRAGVVLGESDGADGNLFNDPSAALTDATGYTCTVSFPDISSVVTPPLAQVSVVNPAAQTKMTLAGTASFFSVETRGVGMTYSWHQNGSVAPLVNGGNYSTATTIRLNVLAATLAQGGTYRCKVSAFGQTVEADDCRLVVVSKPANVLLEVGDSLELNMLTSGQVSPADLSYQWFKVNTPVSSTSSFAIPNVATADGAVYRCTVTLNSVTPNLVVQATNVLVSVLANTSSAHLGVAGRSVIIPVTTTGPAVTYKWYKVDAGGDILINNSLATLPAASKKYAGATTKSLTVLNLAPSDAGYYYCVITGHGSSKQVASQALEVVTSPTSTFALLSERVELTVPTTGTVPVLGYLWKKAGKAVGTNSPSFVVESATLADASSYTCEVTVPGGTTLTSKVVTNAASVAVANINPAPVVANSTATARLVVLTAGAGLSYSWSKVSGADLVPLANPASPAPSKYLALTTSAVSVVGCTEDDAGNYVCQITGHGRTELANPVNLFVRFRPELLPVTFPLAIIGGQFNYSIPFNSDVRKTPVTYTATPLPAGLKLNINTGEITGKPTAAFSKVVTMTARNLAGTSDAVTATLTVASMPTYLTGTYVGVIQKTSSLSATLGGRFDMTVTATGAATGTLKLGTSTYAFATGSSLNVVGTDPATAIANASILVPRGTGASALSTLRITFDIDNSSVLANAKVEDTTNTADFTTFNGWRNSYSASSPATAYQGGPYNFGLLPPGGSDPAVIPQGVGHGSFTVTNLGAYSVAGKTADGETLTTSAFVGPAGQALLYQTLYLTSEKGSLVGGFDINSNGNSIAADNTISSTAAITWNRPVDSRPTATPPTLAQRTYRAGFASHDLTVEGSYYVPPVSPKVILDMNASTTVANALVRFVNGGIESTTSATETFVYSGIRIGASNVVTTLVPNPAAVKLAPVATTGKFTGSFIMLDGLIQRPSTTYQGVIYKKDGAYKGVGYYLHSTKAPAAATLLDPILSGAVFFEAF